MDQTLYHKYDIKRYQNDFGFTIKYILADLIDIDQIKMRNFQRFNGYSLPNYQFEAMGRKYGAGYFPFLVMISTLQQFFPRWHELKEALHKMSNTFPADYTYHIKNTSYDYNTTINKIIEYSIPFILDLKTSFSTKDGNENENKFMTKNENGLEVWIYYNINEYREYKYEGKIQKANQIPPNQEGGFARPNPYWFMLKALEECEKNNFLKAQ